MDLSLSEEQQSLRELVDDILSEDAAPEKLAEILASEDGYPASVQDALHEAGLTAIGLVDDEDATLVELGIILTELGYYAYSGPFLSSAIAALTAARLMGDAGQQVVQKVLGGGIATVANFTVAERQGGAISGTASGVDWASGADLLVLSIPNGTGRTLAVVEPTHEGVSITPQRLMDGTRAGAVLLDGAALPGASVEVSGEQWREHKHVIRLLRAADLLGVIRRVQEMTTTHVAQREQFGKPIGQFQAVQHHLANMAIEQEGAKNLINHALWRYSEGEAFERQAAQAGWFLADAGVRATQVANQLHGGIGFMKEYHLHHFHNRSAVQRGLMGPENERLTELGDVVAEAMEREFQDEFVDWPVR